MKALILALFPSRRAAVLSDSAYLLDHGAQVTLLTLTANDWLDIDARVQIISLAPSGRIHPLVRFERIIVLFIPLRVFALVRRVLRSLSATPASNLAALLAQAVDRASDIWESRARPVHRRFNVLFHRDICPWIMWRTARRHVVPRLHPDQFDLVLIADAQSIPIAWNLLRGHPNLQFTFYLDRPSIEATMPK